MSSNFWNYLRTFTKHLSLLKLHKKLKLNFNVNSGADKRSNHNQRGLTLSWRRPLSYRNQSIDLLHKSMDWFLYDNGLSHERFKSSIEVLATINSLLSAFVLCLKRITTNYFHRLLLYLHKRMDIFKKHVNVVCFSGICKKWNSNAR